MSIIGEGFSDWMKKQVEVRQRTLGSGLVDNKRNISSANTDSISPFLNSSPWIRMASSVDLVQYNETEKKQSSVPKSTKTVLDLFKSQDEFSSYINSFEGSGLAKNFVLHNGVMAVPNPSATIPVAGNQYSGLNEKAFNSNSTVNTGNIFGGTYGFGSSVTLQDGQGPVPMPGITSVSFSYQNDGALSKASVQIKAYSQFQFQLIDVLFQRPGYTVLLEFGHTTFLDNFGNTQYAGQGEYATTSPFNKMWEGSLPQYKIASEIAKEKQKWCGNYEGNFMKISKFNWKFNPDGTYDITCNLVGCGDVINSLKLNTAPNNKLQLKAESGQTANEEQREAAGEDGVVIVSEAIASSLNYALYRVYMTQQIAQGINTGYGAWANFVNFFSSPFANIKIAEAIIPDFPTPNFSIINNDGSIGTYNPKKDQNNPQRIFTSFKYNKKGITIKGGTMSIKNATGSTSSTYTPQTYITFGHLMALLLTNCNLVDSNNIPLTYLNMNFQNLDEDSILVKTFPGHFSADPNICVIPPTVINKDVSDGAFQRQEKIGNYDFVKAMAVPEIAKFAVEGEPEKGRLACVYLDINFIASILKNNKDKEDQSISVLSFLQGILSGINEALGGINNFRVLFNENTHMIDIVNQVPFNDKETDKTQPNLTTINTFGLTPGQGCFITDLSLKAELTDKFAAQISIGAQNNGNTNGTNAGSFSSYNYGLIDRITPIKKQVKEGDAVKDPPEKKNTFTPDPDPIGTIFSDKVSEVLYEVYEDFEFTSEYVSTLKNIQSDYCNAVIGHKASGKTTPDGKATAAAPFFLPFNLGLTMHGISGMRIFQSFKTDGKVLPYTYKSDNVQLIIKSYSHKIDVGGWETSIETMTKPIMGPIGKNQSNPQQNTSTTGTAGSSNSSTSTSAPVTDEGTFTPDPNGTITSGYPLNKIYYDGPTNKTQIYLHHTAGRQNIKNTVHGWNNRTDHVATHYITNNAGEKEQLFVDEAWANHLGLPGSTFRKFGVSYQNLNRVSLGIELQAAGGLKKQSNGTYQTWFKQNLPLSKVARPVDKNGRFTEYKGYQYYEKYSNAQINNIRQIVTGWMSKYGIPYTFNYDELFTLNKVPLTGKPGIYTHNSVRTDKFDVFPQKELIDMLKSIQT
tara:strand:+ start:137 stop:3538 length:3402 start_codon:yes stop_codon:yes gene_type:complete